MDLSIFGGTGFIGSAYVGRWKTHDDINIRPRYSRRPDPYKKTDILYLISTTHNYNVFKDPTLDVNTNLLVLTQALESWKNNNPEGVFNFVSSWFVYGDTDHPTYVDETAVCRPKGFYSITKHCAEQLVKSFAETFGLKYRILRLCNILGPGDKGVSKQKNALQYLMGEMVAGRNIEIYERGQFLRTYMDVEDCVEAIRLVMLDGDLNTVYNIGVEPPQVFMDLINHVHIRTNQKSLICYIEQAPFHKQVQVKSFGMDCSKLYELGFSQKFTIQRTLDRILWVDHGK
jgi:nucleoside-diphosphate-sugar epimerase